MCLVSLLISDDLATFTRKYILARIRCLELMKISKMDTFNKLHNYINNLRESRQIWICMGQECSSMQRVAYIAGIELTCFRSERFRAASTGLMSASSNAIMTFFSVSNIVIGNDNTLKRIKHLEWHTIYLRAPNAA